MKVFPTKINNVVDYICLLSLEEQVSSSKEGFESKELDDRDAGHSNAVLFQKEIKYVFQREIEYIKHDESFALDQSKVSNSKMWRNIMGTCAHHTL